jgi:DnaK suppressor protein
MAKKRPTPQAQTTRPKAKSASAAVKSSAKPAVKSRRPLPSNGKSASHNGKSTSANGKSAATNGKLTTAAPAAAPALAAAKNGDFAEYRELLLLLRARVRGDVEQMTTEALDRNGEGGESKSPTHLAELGTETYEQDFALRRVENEQELLDEIDEALSRIAKGVYGQCVSCMESGLTPGKSMIPKARLRVIPYARNCVECERKRERSWR